MTLQEKLNVLGDVELLLSELTKDSQDSSKSWNTELVLNEQSSGWRVSDVPFPSFSKLQEIKVFVSAKTQEAASTQENLAFLRNTDWKVTRHRDQKDAGTSTSLSEQDFQTLLVQRQVARDSISG